MTVRQYIGARYVPLFIGEWDNTVTYEPLSIVQYQGNSYTSRQYVPTGIEITNTEYWAITGNYNAQVDAYRNEVEQYTLRIDGIEDDIDDLESALDVTNGNVETLQGNIETIDGQIETLQGDIETIDGQIETLQGDIETIDGQIETLQGDIETIDGEIDDLQTDFASVENEKYAKVYGGDGTLIFDIESAIENLELSSVARILARNKKSNEIFVRIRLTNNTGEAIPADTPLVTFKNYHSRYASVTLHALALTIKTDNSLTYGTVAMKNQDDTNGYLSYSYNLPDGADLIIQGTTVNSSSLNWWNSSFYNESLASAICNYFLNGDGESWEGSFRYSTSNSTRLNPEARATDCSGMTYIAYQHYGFHPQNSVQASYLTDGIFIAYAAAGEKLDLSEAKPGDLICYQRSILDPNDQASWTHVTIYAGNNVTYEMAQIYPERETQAGHIDGYGPYRIDTPADEYRMNTEINPITGVTNYGNNRCVVRFL